MLWDRNSFLHSTDRAREEPCQAPAHLQLVHSLHLLCSSPLCHIGTPCRYDQRGQPRVASRGVLVLSVVCSNGILHVAESVCCQALCQLLLEVWQQRWAAVRDASVQLHQGRSCTEAKGISACRPTPLVGACRRSWQTRRQVRDGAQQGFWQMYTRPVVPARIRWYAWRPELMPPQPTMGTLPPVRTYMSLKAACASSRKGSPLSPPACKLQPGLQTRFFCQQPEQQAWACCVVPPSALTEGMAAMQLHEPGQVICALVDDCRSWTQVAGKRLTERWAQHTSAPQG